jgi:hypothetical protein
MCDNRIKQVKINMEKPQDGLAIVSAKVMGTTGPVTLLGQGFTVHEATTHLESVLRDSTWNPLT